MKFRNVSTSAGFLCITLWFRHPLCWLMLLLMASLFAQPAFSATCDQYRGDLWAYTASVKPNMLIIIDTSSSMNDAGVDKIPKIKTAREVISQLVARTKGVNFGVMIYNNKNNSLNRQDSEGSRFMKYEVGGAFYTTTINDMDAIHNGTMTNRQALVAAIGGISAEGWTPLAESLFEAGQYFRGGASKFGNTIGIGPNSMYTSPITAKCQKNVIIFITDGMSTSDDHADLKNICPPGNKNCQGDYDGDKMEPASPPSGGSTDLGEWFIASTNMWHAIDDVAKYLYDTDLLPDNPADPKTIGIQNVSTYVIGFGQVGSNNTAKELLERTANETHGHGAAYMAQNRDELIKSLGKIISSVASVESAFVAPMVPANPDGTSKTTNRLYMGLFKSISGRSWQGNLKKYGLKSDGTIIDKEGKTAVLSNGSFDTNSTSYWSPSPDGGKVTTGGAGEKLYSQNPADRHIYTYITDQKSLSDPVNTFSTTNDKISPALLGVSSNEERDKLIQFTRGFDAYDENKNGSTSDKRDWFFGDVLHSRPARVKYASFIPEEENICAKNSSVIYVGANDGMLHAINDCDGSERWAFIPPDILENLKEIPGQIHTYAVDASPVIYQYDANLDGIIDKKAGDMALMLLATRRGGGESGAPTSGAYYLLDVSDPSAPQYVWRISSNDANFTTLAESWAEPRFTKMKIGSQAKVVVFLPGGYDNANEDSRYGTTQEFDGTGSVYYSDSGSGASTSTGGSTGFNASGRGLYLLEIATLTKGVPTVSPTPQLLWSVVSGMTHSLSADVAVLDVNGDGYTDRVYAADLGGGIWRFDMRSSSPSEWTGNRIFSANLASGSETGRKFFFKPSVTLELSSSTSLGLDATVFIGSGDREHPNNTAVIDRLYAVRDKGQASSEAIDEAKLVDLTEDQLQGEDVVKVDQTLKLLKDSTKYGWYIKLDQRVGEKVVASPAVFNRVAYFTTYTPNLNPVSDPCLPSVGSGRLYAVNYLTGEAIFNFDKNNDAAGTVTNKRARQGEINLLRNDRFLDLGTGVPSGVVIKNNTLIVQNNGKPIPIPIGSGKRFIPLYWGQR